MVKRFLYLELTDDRLNSFIRASHSILGGKPQSGPTHITVRGPYSTPISPETINQCSKDMKYDILRISGVGTFFNKTETVVYFKVDSPNLRNIWKKPDFPMIRFGFNPHISIYRGEDSDWARALYDFFSSEEICILTEKFRLYQHVTRQDDWLAQAATPRANCDDLKVANELIPGLLDRLSVIKEAHLHKNRSILPSMAQLPLL